MYRFAIVASEYNSVITDRLIEGAKRALKAQKEVTLIRVPGGFEIPLAVKQAAASKKYDGVVALGCVIKGETPHFDYISRAVSDGLQRVALETLISLATARIFFSLLSKLFRGTDADQNAAYVRVAKARATASLGIYSANAVITPETIVFAALAGILTALLAALVPAVRSAEEQPADAVRRNPQAASWGYRLAQFAVAHQHESRVGYRANDQCGGIHQITLPLLG